MTVPLTPQTVFTYTANGATTVFPYGCRILSSSDLKVKVNDVLKTIGVDYTVDGVGSSAGGVVTFLVAPTAALLVRIYRATELKRDTDYPTAGDFRADVVNPDFDRAIMAIQDVVGGSVEIANTLRAPAGETLNLLPVASARANKIQGYDSLGQPSVLVGVDAGSATALDLSLRSAVLTTAGAGQVGFGPGLIYGVGTVGKWLVDLATSAGSSALGWIQSGTGAVLRTLTSKLRETVSVKDFGAVGDGTTNDTAAIQAAIAYAAAQYPANNWFINVAYATPRIVDFPSAVYKITGKLLLPNGVVLRGNQSTLVGTGNTVSDNICIETAYISAGVITSNVGTTPETQRVQFARIEGFKFISFKVAVNLYDFNEGCRLADCTFFNCYQAVVADRCFYAQFINLYSREAIALAASALPCFDFRNFVNVEQIEAIGCTNRILGMQFSGGVNGLALRNVGIEVGTTGIKFTGNVNPMLIDTCYFENLTGAALDFTAGGGTQAITIDNNWFNTCGTGISGVNMTGGRIGRGNFFLACTNNVVISDGISTIKVELPFVRAVNTGSLLPALPSGWTLGAGIWREQPAQVYDSGSGVTLAQQIYSGGLTPLPFSGQQGVVTGKVVFCDHSKSAGTTFNVFIDTKLVFEAYLMYVFALTLSDNGGTYIIQGRGYGAAVFFDAASAKALTASNVGGFLRLTVSNLNHPSSTYSCEGIVRMT